MYRTALKALSRGFAAASLASLMIVLHPGSAQAQWVTSGGTVTHQGPVGIGVTTPRAPLHVEGMPLTTGPQAGYSFRNREAAEGTVEDWWWYSSGDVARLSRTGRGDRLAVTSAGHVGVGTADPFQPIGDGTGLGTTIHLHGAAGAGAFRLTRNAVGTLEMGRITFGSLGYTSAEKRTAAISSWSDSNFSADPTGSLRFLTSNAGVMAEKVRITANGRVGIGTAAPSAALHVVGDVTVAGNISAKYQDVAEWVRARRQIAPGTVVALDATLPNAVVPSTRAYDTHVAGVISAQPGVILGEGGEGKVLVATTGRVKIKVDATRRPIKVGDLLVTSGRSGLAMKSMPIRVSGAFIHRPGTIIGKALEPLAKGRGEILVLLSLQ